MQLQSLVGCSPWGREESDTTEQLHFHALEEKMATYPSILAWRILWMEEPGGLWSMGLQRVWHDWATNTHTYNIYLFMSMADSLRPHGLQLTRFLCLWDSPGKNTGVGCHVLLQGIFPIQGSNSSLLHYRQILYHLSHQGSLMETVSDFNFLRSKITADVDCSHEIKRCLLLGRKLWTT